MTGVVIEGRSAWTFGASTFTGAIGAVLGSTGRGATYSVLGLAREQSFYIETDGGATCSYQILSARASTGPWVVLSSGTLSTGALDLVQLTGPLAYVAPRIKTITSTSVNVFAEYYGN